MNQAGDVQLAKLGNGPDPQRMRVLKPGKHVEKQRNRRLSGKRPVAPDSRREVAALAQFHDQEIAGTNPATRVRADHVGVAERSAVADLAAHISVRAAVWFASRTHELYRPPLPARTLRRGVNNARGTLADLLADKPGPQFVSVLNFID